MRGTERQGKPHKMVFESGPNKGKSKGAQQILLERGYTLNQIREMKLEGCIKELEKPPDLATEKMCC